MVYVSVEPHLIHRSTSTPLTRSVGVRTSLGMLRRVLKPLATTAVCIGAPAYLYHRYTSEPKPQTFDISVRQLGTDGKSTMVARPISLLSKAQVDKRINEHATLESTTIPGGLTWKYTTAYLPSNDPIEDANAQAIIAKASSIPSSLGQLLFFAVMDGHSGRQTSQLLSKVLIPAVALELSTMVTNPETNLTTRSSVMNSIRSLLFPKANPQISSDATPSQITHAIRDAFANLDSEIVNAPLRLLTAHLTSAPSSEKLTIPDLSQHSMGVASMLPAMSGQPLHRHGQSYITISHAPSLAQVVARYWQCSIQSSEIYMLPALAIAGLWLACGRSLKMVVASGA